MNKFFLTDKIIVVTGASSGIGRAIAVTCAQMGAHIILVGRKATTLEETAALFPETTRRNIVISDLQGNSLSDDLAASVGKLGRIDGFVHSAGVSSILPLRAMRVEQYLSDYSINAIAAFDLSRLFSSKKFISPNGGSFVFISSVSAHKGAAALSSYAASKGALISGMRSLAIEFAPKKIRVNTVSPSHIANTGMNSVFEDQLPQETYRKTKEKHLLGLGLPNHVAGPVAFLLSDAAEWITGTDITVDGGYSLG